MDSSAPTHHPFSFRGSENGRPSTHLAPRLTAELVVLLVEVSMAEFPGLF